MSSIYLVALGSNQRRLPFGEPRAVVRAAMEELSSLGTVIARSDVLASDPVGPSQRRYANAAALVESEYDPAAMLAGLQSIERSFGRERRGQRWRARSLDLDLILWSGGAFSDEGLAIPHPRYRERDFVLAPAAQISPEWRDPIGGLSIRQLHARLTRGRTLPSARSWSGR